MKSFLVRTVMRPRRLAVAGCATVVVVISWVALEKGLAVLYSRMQPKLESLSEDVLGRPVILGSFRGLSWQGFHIGPTQVLASANDQSQLKVEELIVSLSPLSSLQQRRWVVHLHALDLQGELRRNAQGSFWTIKQGDSPKPMPAEIWLHTKGPALVQAWLGPGSGQPPDLALTFEGRAALGHARHGTVADGTVSFHDGGRLSFYSQGTPLSQTWDVHGEADALQLAVLRPLLGDSPLQDLSGQVEGEVTLHWSKDRSCRGELNITATSLSGPDWAEELGLEELGIAIPKLHCDGDRIQLDGSSVQIGELTGQVQGFWDLEGDVNLNASLMGPFPPMLAPVIVGGELNSELHLFGPVTGLEGQINLTVAGWRRRQSTIETMTPEQQLLPPLEAQVQLASRWRPSVQDFDFQLGGSLQAQAGDSNLAVTGQWLSTTNALQLESTTLNVAPREWLSPGLADALFPPQPYEGQMAVEQTAAGQTLHLRLHNPQLEEPLALNLACDTLLELNACETLELTGSLELASGHLKGEVTDGRWQLEIDVMEPDLAIVWDRLPTLPFPPPRLNLAARAHGEYDLAEGEVLLAGGQLTAGFSDDLRIGETVLLEPDSRLELVGEEGQWELEVNSRALHSRGVVYWSPSPSWQEVDFDLSLNVDALSLNTGGLVEALPATANLDFDGRLSGALLDGALAQLHLNGELQLGSVDLGPIQAPPTWSGAIQASSDGHDLDLVAQVGNHQRGGMGQPTLQARLTSAWQLHEASLHAGEGSLDVQPTEDGYRLTAADLPLSWLAVGLAGKQDKAFQAPLLGQLNGEGAYVLNSGQLEAALAIHGPRLGPLQGRQLQLNVRRQDHQWRLDGQLDVDDVDAKGALVGGCQFDRQPGTAQPWSCQGNLVRLPLRPLRQGVELVTAIGQGSQFGGADDLANTTAISLSDNRPLDSFTAAQERFQEQTGQAEMSNDWLLKALQGEMNGNLQVKGSTDQPVHVVLGTDLDLWLPEDKDQDNHEISGKPVRLWFGGSLEQGTSISRFIFSGLPLRLLALVNPQLSLQWICMSQFNCSGERKEADLLHVLEKFPLQGQLQGKGTVQNLLGVERKVVVNLDLQEGQINHSSISLSPANFLKLEENTLEMDLALQSTSRKKQNFLALKGKVFKLFEENGNTLHLALSLRNEVLALLVSSSADGLAFLEFLEGLSDETLVMKKGNASFIGLVEGKLEQPIFTGYGRVTDFQGSVADIPIGFSGVLRFLKSPNTKMPLVSFHSAGSFKEPLEIAVGHSGGKVKVSGAISLSPHAEEEQKTIVDLENVRLENLDVGPLTAGFLANGKLELKGSIIPPKIEIGNRLQISQGSAIVDVDATNTSELATVSSPDHLSSESAPFQTIEWVNLDNLKVDFSDVELQVPPYANFTLASEGDLQLNGFIGTKLEVDGLVKLSKGQLSYLGTSFSLDQSAKNTILFSSDFDMGIFPYLDVSMWSSAAEIAKRQYLANNKSNNIGNNISNIGKGKVVGSIQGQFTQDHLDKLTESPLLSNRHINEFLGKILKIENSLGLSQDELAQLFTIDAFGKAVGHSVFRVVSNPSQNLDSLARLELHSQTNLQGRINNTLRQNTSVSLLPTLLLSSTALNNIRTTSEYAMSMELILDINSRLSLLLISNLHNHGDLETSYGLYFHPSPITTARFDINRDGNWESTVAFGYRF